ncbi:hypothetical protein Bca4012_058821 [Brassica carinata]
MNHFLSVEASSSKGQAMVRDLVFSCIVVGGKNKYLINGKLAQPIQVQNLFHSLQLNVNNYHITKVFNMKPPEILSVCTSKKEWRKNGEGKLLLTLGGD